MTVIALALVLAAAPDPVAEAQKLLEQGLFDAALARLDRALPGAEPKLVSRVQLARAQCLAALRRNADIEPAMEAALDAEPTTKPAEGEMSPGLQATFERVRARLAGTVEVETEPTGLTVLVDGALVGRSPVRTLLPVGGYTLTVLDARGQTAAERPLVVRPRQSQKVLLQTAPPSATPVAETVETPPSLPPASSSRAAIEPAAAVRASYEVLGAGLSLEAAAQLLGRYWLVELSGLYGRRFAVGIRAGARLPFASGRFSAQLTADGLLFFSASVRPGGGATLSLAYHPVSFLDVMLDAGARAVSAEPGFRSGYGLLGLTLRGRWPNGIDGD